MIKEGYYRKSFKLIEGNRVGIDITDLTDKKISFDSWQNTGSATLPIVATHEHTCLVASLSDLKSTAQRNIVSIPKEFSDEKGIKKRDEAEVIVTKTEIWINKLTKEKKKEEMNRKLNEFKNVVTDINKAKTKDYPSGKILKSKDRGKKSLKEK